MTPRDLCSLLTALLGVDAVPFAARLVRAGVLPRAGERIAPHEAAALLLTMLGALKREMIDLWVSEKNKLFRAHVAAVKASEKQKAVR